MTVGDTGQRLGESWCDVNAPNYANFAIFDKQLLGKADEIEG